MNENEKKVTYGYLYSRKHKYLNNKNSRNLRHKRILLLQKNEKAKEIKIYFLNPSNNWK